MKKNTPLRFERLEDRIAFVIDMHIDSGGELDIFVRDRGLHTRIELTEVVSNGMILAEVDGTDVAAFPIAQVKSVNVNGARTGHLEFDMRTLHVDSVVRGGRGPDLLIGGYGRDRLIGGSGNDSLFGNHGQDRLEGGNGHDTLDGGCDRDTLIPGGHVDNIFATIGLDVIKGLQRKDHVVNVPNVCPDLGDGGGGGGGNQQTPLPVLFETDGRYGYDSLTIQGNQIRIQRIPPLVNDGGQFYHVTIDDLSYLNNRIIGPITIRARNRSDISIFNVDGTLDATFPFVFQQVV